MQNNKPKIIIILGQTATGKSDLAVQIARRFNGEVISADSRQVYKGLDIGSGKITTKEMKCVRHHLLDVASPRWQFSVADYKKLATKAINEIYSREKIPIIAGGTGFYIDALLGKMCLPEVTPNPNLRKRLGKLNIAELFKILKKLDLGRANTVDQKNKVRLIRAIEIAKALGHVPTGKVKPCQYETLKIGLKLPDDILKIKIKKRLEKRMRNGMAIELHGLRHQGIPWRRFEALGFDQKYVALFLQDKIDQKEMLESLLNKNWQYAKRQWTWFKRDQEIHWFNPTKKSNLKKIDHLVKKFIKNPPNRLIRGI